jgi:hypothetical protein
MTAWRGKSSSPALPPPFLFLWPVMALHTPI